MGASGGEPPLVSVVLPTYDRPAMLRRAVRSIANQEYPNVELLVVDDHSPTPAERVLSGCDAGTGIELRCLRHNRNRGANAARITGIQAAEGDFLAFLDDDDRWDETKLAKQVSGVRSHEDVGLVTCGQRYVNEAGRQTGTELPAVDGEGTADILSGKPFGTFSTVLVNRTVVDRAGLPDEEFPCWQDLEWFVRLSQHTECLSVREPLVVRQIGDHEQISDGFVQKRDIAYPLFLEKHCSLATELGCEPEFLASIADKVAGPALATGHYREAIRFALNAVRADPVRVQPYLYVALALGGDLTYRPAIFLKRYITHLTS